MKNILPLLDTAAKSGTGEAIMMTLLYVVIIGVGIYFLMIRPQKKQDAKHKALVSSMEIGDSVLTTAGFYGVVIDITDDTVIVEFGSNKNCRIPMKKEAIVDIEKPTSEAE